MSLIINFLKITKDIDKDDFINELKKLANQLPPSGIKNQVNDLLTKNINVNEVRQLIINFYLKKEIEEQINRLNDEKQSAIKDFLNEITKQFNNNPTEFQKIGAIGLLGTQISYNLIKDQLALEFCTTTGLTTNAINPELKQAVDNLMMNEPQSPTHLEVTSPQSYQEDVFQFVARRMKGYPDAFDITYKTDLYSNLNNQYGNDLFSYTKSDDYIYLYKDTEGDVYIKKEAYEQIKEYVTNNFDNVSYDLNEEIRMYEDAYNKTGNEAYKEKIDYYKNLIDNYKKYNEELENVSLNNQTMDSEYELKLKEFNTEFERLKPLLIEHHFWTGIVNNFFCLATLPLIKYFNKSKKLRPLAKIIAFSTVYKATGQGIAATINWNKIPYKYGIIIKKILGTDFNVNFAALKTPNLPPILYTLLQLTLSVAEIYLVYKMLTPDLTRDEKKQLISELGITGRFKEHQLMKVIDKEKEERIVNYKNFKSKFAKELIKTILTYHGGEVTNHKVKNEAEKMIDIIESYSDDIGLLPFFTDNDNYREILKTNNLRQASIEKTLNGRNITLISQFNDLNALTINYKSISIMDKKYKNKYEYYKKRLEETKKQLSAVINDLSKINAYYISFIREYLKINYFSNIKKVKNKINNQLLKVYKELGIKKQFNPINEYGIIDIYNQYYGKNYNNNFKILAELIIMETKDIIKNELLKIDDSYKKSLKDYQKIWSKVIKKSEEFQERMINDDKIAKKRITDLISSLKKNEIISNEEIKFAEENSFSKH